MPTIEEGLFERPYEFNFFQAIRLLSHVYPARLPVGGDVPPSSELVRFRTHQSLSFAPSSIYELDRESIAGAGTVESRPRMAICFLGLTGRQGVLPFHYTEHLIERLQQKDHAAADFFDLFLHRLASFFYRAWEKHSLLVQYEQARFTRKGPEGIGRHILDLIGLASPRIHTRARLDPNALVYYSGILGQRPRSATGLEQLLRDFFQVEVKVSQFHGKWFTLDPLEWTDLETVGAQNRLGEGASLGNSVWNPQAMIRAKIGPLRLDQYEAFLPSGMGRQGGAALPLLIAWIRLYLDGSADFDIQLSLEKSAVPPCYLWAEWDERLRARTIGDQSEPPALGLTTWLRTSEFDHDAADVVLTSLADRSTMIEEAS